MGLYNTYGERGLQLKIGSDLCLRHFDVGDDVDLLDGVYVGYEGVIVVKDGVLIAEFDCVMTKWGDELFPKAIIEQHNPILEAVKMISKRDFSKEDS